MKESLAGSGVRPIASRLWLEQARAMRFLPLVAAALCSCSGDSPPPTKAPLSALIGPEAGVIRIAGTGALSPLVYALTAAWSHRAGSLRVVVEDSIGSGGGVRAAADGAVDLGMISRVLTVEEQRFGLREVAIATDAVVMAAHPDVPISGLTSAELRALYADELRTFSDGSPATVLLRDRGESANGTLDRAVPGMAAAREMAYARGRMRVLYHDAAMVEALVATPFAIGVINLGEVAASGSALKVLTLDGKRPSIATLADGTWPMTRPLAFVARGDRIARVVPLLDFIASDEGAAITRSAGYLPAPRSAP